MSLIRLTSSSDPLPYWEGSYPDGPIEFWDRVEKKKNWDALFSAFNTAEFTQALVTDEQDVTELSKP